MNRAVRSTLECVRLDAAFGSFSASFQGSVVVSRSSAFQGGVKLHALQGASHIRLDAVISEAHEQQAAEPYNESPNYGVLCPKGELRMTVSTQGMIRFAAGMERIL